MKTYGRVWLTGRTWRIDVKAAPHVAMRLRRHFERIDKGEMGVLSLSATAEASRELAWFMGRYPMVIADGDRARMDELVLEHKRREALVEKIVTGTYVPPLVETAIPLRDYQRVSVGMVLATHRLILVDELGLGKTAQGIGVIVDPRARPAVVVTKTDLPIQWRGEIERFAPGLRVHVITSGKPYDLRRGAYDRRLRQHGTVEFPDVIILNYHKLDGWAERLSQFARSLILDEIQELRIPESAKYKAARYLADRVDYRLGLSATPIYNYGGEMYWVLNLIAPDALGTHAEFCREWCGLEREGDKPRVGDPDAFGVYLRDQGLMLRRTLEDVGMELPPFTQSVQYVESDVAALADVNNRAIELARVILAQTGYSRKQRMDAASELSWMLRQATGIAKAPYVAAFVRLLIESGERVVLAGWHKAVDAIWAAALKDLEWTKPGDKEPSKVQPLWWVGDDAFREVRSILPDAIGDKEKVKQAFIAGESPLIIMSLRAGAGIDGLQKVCRVVVYGELDWSPGVHKQFGGRIYRPGQEKPAIAYFLVAEDGSDPIVIDVLGVKKAQADGVIDPGEEIVETIEIEEGHIKKLAAAYLERHGVKVTA